MDTDFFLAGVRAQWEECGGRILLGDNACDRSDSSVLEFGFKPDSRPYAPDLNIRVLNSDLRHTFRIATIA